MRVAVIGGGISGLATAFLARQAGHDVSCFEPGEAPGGLMRSERHEGFLCELGPQAMLGDAPRTLSLLAALGLEPRILRGSTEAKRRFIFAHDRLWPVPLSPPALLTSGLLSLGGKLRLIGEPMIARRRVPQSDDRESVAEFGDRRLGREASRVLLSTAAIGIYAGDADGLSASSGFPRMAALERNHGSLLAGMIAARRAARRNARANAQSPATAGAHPLSFPEGLGELAGALAQALGDGLRRTTAVEVTPGSSLRWRVTTEGAQGSPEGREARATEADSVVIAASATSTASLLRPLVSSLAPPMMSALDVLTTVRRAPIALACLGFRDARGTSRSMGMELEAYGFLVARGERPRMLGCQYESSIFADRAPPGGVLLRAILGGIGPGFEPEIVDRTDDEIAARALGDLRRVAGLSRDPDLVRIWRHREGIPQYAPGHAARTAALDLALRSLPGLHVIGYTVRGVGVNDCIQAAADVVAKLA